MCNPCCNTRILSKSQISKSLDPKYLSEYNFSGLTKSEKRGETPLREPFEAQGKPASVIIGKGGRKKKPVAAFGPAKASGMQKSPMTVWGGQRYVGTKALHP